MTPFFLPLALWILAGVASPALAAPAPGAGDFDPMLTCHRKAHAFYFKIKSFMKSAAAEKAASAAVTNGLDAITQDVDQTAWAVNDQSALPAGCRIGEPQVKEGVYAALSDLRREVNEKAAAALEGEQKAEADELTRKESAVDALMGGEAKTVAELKSKLAGLGLSRDTGGSSEEPTRSQRLARRYRSLSGQIAAAESMGGGMPGANIPDAVRDREAKSVAEARKRAAGAKGVSFGGDKNDDLPNGAQTAEDRSEGGPGTAQTAEIRGSGSDSRGALTEANAGGRSAAKKPGPRAKLAVDTADIQEDTDPDEGDSGALTEAVANSAKKPLGGAVNPPAAGDANIRDSRKEAALRTAKRIDAMPTSTIDERMDKAIAEAEFGSAVVGRPKNGEGEIYLKRSTTNQPATPYKVSGYKLAQVRPGDLTPEEEAVIEVELAKLKRLGK